MPYFVPTLTMAAGIISEVYFSNFFMIVWIPYVLYPLLDFILPVDHSNVTTERVRLMEKDKRFLIPVYLVWILDICVFIWILHRVSIGDIGNTVGSFILYVVCAA